MKEDPILAALEARLSGIAGLQGVYLFGSAGTEAERPGSDVDVAILAAVSLDERSRLELGSELARALRRDVDLVDLRRASTVMRAQVVSTGRRIVTRDSSACDQFEATALSAYALLNEERRGILADVKRRGNIYG